MGTTLALNGAYTLAGALTQYPNDHTAAFDMYEEKMRPLVDRAQKLFPGAPHIISPETAWAIWMLHAIMWVLSVTRINRLPFVFAGPPANAVPVEEYGFEQLPEMER